MVLLLIACENDPSSQPMVQDEFKFEVPDHFPEVAYPIENNPITEAGFILGKRLFFDTRLSADNSISCSSCHLQARAFSDASHHGFSVGVGGSLGTRNAPAIQNVAFKAEFALDGGVSHLDFTSVNAITNPLEMKEDLASVMQKIRQDSLYPQMFQDAFDEDTITSAYMLQAIAQFMLMMISDQSDYDAWVRGEYQLSSQEESGRVIFEKSCSSCHSGVLQSEFKFKDNGIGVDTSDTGRFLVTERESDEGKFIVPSLRNVAITAPYMHNSKFLTLEEVIDHYSEGIQRTENLASEIPEDGFQFSENQKAQVLAFLQTLTDDDFTSNPTFFSYKESQ